MLSWNFLSLINSICVIEGEAEGFGGFKFKHCGIVTFHEIQGLLWSHESLFRASLRNNYNFANPNLMRPEGTLTARATGQWKLLPCTPSSMSRRVTRIRMIRLLPIVVVVLQTSTTPACAPKEDDAWNDHHRRRRIR